MDPDRRVLLVHFDFEGPDMPTGLWACPGGGVDPGETHADALRRELREELGLAVEDADVGEPIWFSEHEFDLVGWDGQADSCYLVEVDAFEPAPQFSQAELLAEHVDGRRWWTWAELQQTQPPQVSDDPAGTDPTGTDPANRDLVTLSPRPLVRLLEDLMTYGRPLEPVRVDRL